LPSVAEALASDEASSLRAAHPAIRVTEAFQQALAARRNSGRPGTPTMADLAGEAAAWLAADEVQRLRPVVNATGVILHTNLGRAVLPPAAVRALASLDRCCNLQIDLETGARGKRHDRTERLLCRLTGAEAALVVNNNAAATYLVLAVLCAGREVIVSRGQLIEIGGSFRLPDCIHQSGATLVEVGTTNKTHRRDYEAALNERTAAVLRVNPSNYRIIGFAQDVPLRELVPLKEGRENLLVIDDLGCGALVDLREFGLPYEPTVPESVSAGADLALFSGDKLIGGPQAGIIVGRADLVRRIRKHPLTRMLRVGKMTDLALEHTLRLFLEPDRLPETNPTWRMLTAPMSALEARMRVIQKALGAGVPGLSAEPASAESSVGGGSLPGHPIPSLALVVRKDGVSAEALLGALRQAEPPVIGYIRDDRVWLDLRTVLDGEEEAVASAVRGLARRTSARTGQPA
jgi:L-seryl-tRNA(Ser) seleniumtransferase